MICAHEPIRRMRSRFLSRVFLQVNPNEPVVIQCCVSVTVRLIGLGARFVCGLFVCENDSGFALYLIVPVRPDLPKRCCLISQIKRRTGMHETTIF